MRSNIKLNLYKLVVPQLLALLNFVIEKMTANALLFAAPPISMAALQTLSDKFFAAIKAATEGGVNDRKVRDKLVLEVRDALRIQADYVRSVCNGDAALLTLSGFELSKMPEPITEVGIPANVRAERTDSKGELLVRWGKTVGGRMFRVEQASSNPALGEVTWSTVALTGRQRVVIGGLVSRAEGYFRVVAMGITHEGMPSDIVMAYAA